MNITDFVLFYRGLTNFFKNENTTSINFIESGFDFPNTFSKTSADEELKLFSNELFFEFLSPARMY
jgi:hypothetical protein